jgi:maleylpyruvate isomerase
MPDEPIAAGLHDATQRLVREVDGLTPEAWSGPSLLPGWTRAHVVAHLTLNAEALAGALAGVVQAEPTPMYASQGARDADIEELAGQDPTELRDRLLASTTLFADALAAVPEDLWTTRIERTRGSERTFTAHAVPGMRWREVEIHAADLAASYTHADWPTEFAVHLVRAMTKRPDGVPGLVARATDVDHTWKFGDGGPVVSGTAADLGWWLTGRGAGEGLTSDSGELPRMGAW